MSSWLNSLAVYVHQINPFAIGPIRWYGLSYLMGFLFAFLMVRRICRVGRSNLAPDKVGDLILYVAFGTLIGGRLGYCIFYKPEYLVEFTGQFPFWSLLAINQGGMASHGGIIGVLVACWLFARKNKIQYLFTVDLIAVAAPLGLFFGRIANFINGELYGRPVVDTNFPLGVKFPQELADWYYSDHEKYLEVVRQLPAPSDFGYYAPEWTPDMILQQVQQHNQTIIDLIAPMITLRHPSQIYQALLEGLSLFIIVMIIYMKPRKPGTIMFSFLVGYGFFRIVAEFFREPDDFIGYQALGLTRGQWLTVPVIIVGVVGIIWCSLRKTEPLGGWLKTASNGQAMVEDKIKKPAKD
ncbi:prolipoprotein diacylglyceryl transferase [Poriferisphaera sp. WC338]|uniref:prolipoprotein diacylglyceryl transferase n=1 Tax=Poriferisphaera sp. WC338 TaxID=3425129 RepID=UPI003D8176C9